jgi:hypothetical protein
MSIDNVTEKNPSDQLFHAIINDDKDAFNRSLSDVSFNVRNECDAGLPALSIAVLKNNEAMVNALLAKGADPLVRNDVGWSPILFAAKKNNFEIFAILLDAAPHATKEEFYEMKSIVSAEFLQAIFALQAKKAIDSVLRGETVTKSADTEGESLNGDEVTKSDGTLTFTIAEAMMANNLSSVAMAMRRHKVTHVEVRYSGSGDSGDSEEVEVYKDNISSDNSPVLVEDIIEVSVNSRYEIVASGELKKTHEFSPMLVNFKQACLNLMEEAISIGNHDGWEINEGGGGTLTINLDGTAVLSHYDNYPVDDPDAPDEDDEEYDDYDAPTEENYTMTEFEGRPSLALVENAVVEDVAAEYPVNAEPAVRSLRP